MKPGPDGRAPARGDPTNPPEAAGAPRDALADAAAKAGRLVSVLRRSSEQKALQTVPGRLKQLSPGTGEPQ